MGSGSTLRTRWPGLGDGRRRDQAKPAGPRFAFRTEAAGPAATREIAKRPVLRKLGRGSLARAARRSSKERRFFSAKIRVPLGRQSCFSIARSYGDRLFVLGLSVDITYSGLKSCGEPLTLWAKSRRLRPRALGNPAPEMAEGVREAKLAGAGQRWFPAAGAGRRPRLVIFGQVGCS